MNLPKIAFRHELPTAGKRTVFGICVHTTGDGVPAAVERTGMPHHTVALATYTAMESVGPHFVIDPFGYVAQYADPGLIRHHVGLEAEHRRSFLDGHWTEDANRISRDCVAWWQARWPQFRSPSHLYPSDRPNKDYIGIELIPAGTYVKNKGWTFQHGSRPGFDKQRFSVEQYVALARLAQGLAEAYGIDLTKRNRLLGHEDLNPYTRPGWDPGDARQFFSWELLSGIMGAL